MKQIERRHRPPRLPNYDYTTPGYYFVTFNTIVRNQPILCAISSNLSVVPAALGGPCPVLTPAGEIVHQLIENIPHVYSDVSVDCFVIMPDHVHLIVVLGCQDGPPRAAGTTDKRKVPTSLETVINSLKGLASRRHGASLWQDGFYDHVLRNDSDLAETRDYIHQNPLKSLEIKD